MNDEKKTMIGNLVIVVNTVWFCVVMTLTLLDVCVLWCGMCVVSLLLVVLTVWMWAMGCFD